LYPSCGGSELFTKTQTKGVKAMLKEFQKFIARGSVFDLAVGIVIGAAFTAIINSFVDDLLMPVLGIFTGGLDFSNLFIALDGGDYTTLAEAIEAGAATFNYGLFINAVINFLIVAFALFLIVRQVNKMHEEEEAPAPSPEPSNEEKLLMEIRDLLAEK
jgi:large conductance mechanosensitive channel